MINKRDLIISVKCMLELTIGDEWAAQLVKSLEEINFFDAPASTKYHEAYPGGLAEHSLRVADNLVSLTRKLGLVWQDERSPYIIGLLHDLCKCDQYTKNEDGSYSYNKDLMLNGHGEKSVIIAQNILPFQLTSEEILCIRWHMGAYDEKENWTYLGKAIDKYENVLWTHTADNMAAHYIKK